MDKKRIEELVRECNVPPVGEVKMRHIITTAVLEAYEEAAKECDKLEDGWHEDAEVSEDMHGGRHYRDLASGAGTCAVSIRKLGEGL